MTSHIFKAAVKKNDIFQENKELNNYLLKNLQLLLFLPEDEICVQGEEGENLYFISKGECEVYVRDQSKRDKYIAELKTGEYFGDVTLLKQCPRTATGKSKNYSTCAAMSLKIFSEVQSRFPDII